jgi:hypothetical protein
MDMRRETSRVSFLMCPFCVRGALLVETTHGRGIAVGGFGRVADGVVALWRA